MKIKRVKIKAFRLFKDETIDLTNKIHKDKASNFVVIHAPNGFGKTSFFDALEFCMTNNIQRVKDNFKENFKIDQEQNNTTFIHNRNMPEDDIDISMDFENGSKIQTTCKPNEEAGKLKGEARNKYFRNAILSQDWFSEFLSTKSSEQRFEIFMDYFSDTQDLLNYHRTLKTNITIFGRKETGLKKEVAAIKSKLIKKIDNHIIEKITKVVDDLIKNDIETSWTGSICGNELNGLLMEAKNSLHKLNFARTKNEELSVNMNQIILGQNNLLTFDEISEYKMRIITNLLIFDFYQAFLNLIVLYKRLNQQVVTIEKEKKEKTLSFNRLNYLVTNYDQYIIDQNELHKLITEKECQIKTRESLYEQHKDKHLEIKYADETWKKLDEQKQKIDNKIKTLHGEHIKYTALKKEDKILVKYLEESEKEKTKQNEQKGTDEILLNRLIKQKNDVFNRKLILESNLNEDEVQTILIIQSEIQKKETDTTTINQNIDEQIKYKNDVEELLINSRKLISGLTNGVCPLCGYDYEDQEILLKKIEVNGAISTSIENSIEEKETLFLQINTLKNDLDIAYDSLIKNIDSHIEIINKKTKVSDESILKYTNSIEQNLVRRSEISCLINESYIHYEEKNEDVLREEYAITRVALTSKIADADSQNKSLKIKTDNISDDIKKSTKVLDECQINIGKMKSKESFIQYNIYIKQDVIASDELNEWKRNKDELDKDIIRLQIKLSDLNIEINALKDKNISIEQESSLNDSINKLQEENKLLHKQLSDTLSFILINCNVKDINNDTEINIIKSSFNDILAANTSQNNLITAQKTIIENYINLLNLGMLYNKNEENKNEFNLKESDKKKVVQQKKELIDEQNKLEIYLTNFVKGYFQIDLINQLYNSIDPHPDYKEIKFECDFSKKEPKLNVLMYSKTDNQNAIVPSLYFSTAQMNILSFCIFLAKALCAKTDKNENLDCIFIDDPIQALDDINILSMIDLLRNVAFSLDRQIVLTTHDKNFFELLKMKVPDSLFHSKFLNIKEKGVFDVV